MWLTYAFYTSAYMSKVQCEKGNYKVQREGGRVGGREEGREGGKEEREGEDQEKVTSTSAQS